MKKGVLKALACAASMLAVASAANATVYKFTLTGDSWSGYWYMDLNPATAYAGNVPPAETFSYTAGDSFLVTDVQGDPGSLPGFTADYVADVTFWNAANDGGLTLNDFYADPGNGGVDVFILSGAQLYTGGEDNPVFLPTNGTPWILWDWQDNTKRFTLSIDDCGCNPTPPPVPEPASWALMLLGFGALGGALRARKATVSFA